jgi:DNA repair exonuclease SbcCD ATPase subunit
MIEIKEIEFRNFLSWGDYITKISLDELGQCLILGEVIDDEDGDRGEEYISKTSKSNGAGKSSIISAIQYGLFGRTMHNTNPGNKVVNWFTGKDCYVKITMKNGDSITRLRNVNGVNEIIYTKDGDENKLTSETLSTAAAQQQKLDKIFNLDWDVFCGSVFFTQYGKPWLEMADTVRKKAIERILHIDRFTCYSKVAKDKADAVERSLSKRRAQVESLISNINSTNANIARLQQAIDNYDISKTQRYQFSVDAEKSELDKRDKLVLPDLESLSKKWDIVAQAKIILEKYDDQIIGFNRQLATKEGMAKSYSSRISEWKNKNGKMCVECEQEITSTHTTDRIAPLQEEYASLLSEINEIKDSCEIVKKKLFAAKELISTKSPKMTLEDARTIHRQWKSYDDNAKRHRKDIERILAEESPHNEMLAQYVADLEKLSDDKVALESEIERNAALTAHYTYIQKAYSDRNKIKSYVFDEHIPYINKRLKHYLEVLGLDIQIQLNSSLGVDSNLWGYEFESGGERKRTDVAFMLAMFDLHELIYGRQCNIIVLDEVDGRLDDDGINGLVNIIKNDISSKVESVLIVSHKDSMKDMFHKQLLVRRTNRFSQLVDIR